jgi:5-formyltetrahydrofolate cyclo-ligase
MMSTFFEPVKRRRTKAFVPCFLLLIMLGWALMLWLSGIRSLEALDALVASVPGAASGAASQAVPEAVSASAPLYALPVNLIFQAGSAIFGSGGGTWAFVLVQSLVLASACALVCVWLYAEGTPLGLVLIIVLICAALAPLACAAVRPETGALLVVGLPVATVNLIAALADNCAGLRRLPSLCALLALFTVLMLAEPLMIIVLGVTLIALCLTPGRGRGKLRLLSLIVLGLCLTGFLVVLPALGWTGHPFARLMPALPSPLRLLLVVPGLIMLVICLIVVRRRRARYVLPFVPLTVFALLFLFTQAFATMELPLALAAFASTLPFLALIPFLREYHETKAAIRERFLALRAAIPAAERATRSEVICSTLLNRLTKLQPEAGYIGLYSAQGSEMSCALLAVQLSALGYRTAYPGIISDTEMAFFTTCGVSDRALFKALLEDRPFKPITEIDLSQLRRVAPFELSALVVPGVAFDRDQYRIGYGGGYYDRYVAQLNEDTPIWGVGFQEQLTDSVPVEKHDLPLNGIVVG